MVRFSMAISASRPDETAKQVHIASHAVIVNCQRAILASELLLDGSIAYGTVVHLGLKIVKRRPEAVAVQ